MSKLVNDTIVRLINEKEILVEKNRQLREENRLLKQKIKVLLKGDN